MGPKVTIYEVAQRAGVGISTVSNTLNRPDRVAEATRRKVLEAADALGFTPKQQAVSLARKGVGRIGVIAPLTSYPSYMRRLSGVLEAIGRHNLEVCIFDEESAASQTSLMLSSLPLTSRLDGIMVMGVPLDEDAAQRLLSKGIPTVLVDTVDTRFTSVATDDDKSGRLAAQYLVELGHREIAYVMEAFNEADQPQQGTRRLRAFEAELAAHGITVDRIEVDYVAHAIDDARNSAHRLLARPSRPTAIAAHDDLLAMGVLQAAQDLGLRVPEDLTVIGCDDGDLAQAARLTTIRQPFEESGRVAADLLLGQLRSDSVRQVVMLDQELVVRNSSAPPSTRAEGEATS